MPGACHAAVALDAPFELDVTGADVLCRYIGLDTATAVPIGS